MDQKTPAALTDLDVQGWGDEVYLLRRPFRFRGEAYAEVKVRVPTGADVERRIRGVNPMAEMKALVEDLTDLHPDVLGVMYAADRAGLMALVGKHMAAAPEA